MKFLLAILTSSALLLSLHAQVAGQGGQQSGPGNPSNAKPATPPLPPQGATPAPVPRMASNTGPNAMAAREGEIIDGSNWDDQDVADEYSKYTGKRVLLSSATQGLEIRFFQRGPLTNRQAAALLVKVLDMEGYVFVPSGVNEVKLLPKAQGSGANGPAELEDIIDDVALIPPGDDYISYFMKLSFIKPEEAVRTFTQSIHGLGPGAKIAPIPNASAVLITGKATFVRKLINQQKFIDVPTGNVATAWVELKYADSEEVATTLNEIMNAEQQSKTTAGVTKLGNSGGQAPAPGVKVPTPGASASATAAGEDIPVQIVPDPRLNKIFIMGRPVDIVFVEGLVRQFDAPPNRSSFFKRKLHFVIASDFLQVAADALEAHNGPTSDSSQRQSASRTSQQRNPANRSTGFGDRGNSRSGNVESVEEFNVSDVPESIVVGKTFIVADNLANSILVQGPPESVRIISELADKLDGRPQQVMISTVFGEATLGQGTDIGVSLGAVARGGDRDAAGSTGGGGILPTFADLLTNAGLNTASAGDFATGLNVYGRINDFTGVMRALETRSDFKILSRPTVYTANNRKAVISSGSRIAVPTNQFNSGTTGQSTNIEYQDVLLRFEVVPLINSEDEVTLRISLINDTVGEDQTVGDLTVPTIGTETVTTTVTVKNNTTIVIGGLVTEVERNSKSGVPVLSRIPGVGRLFGRTKKSVERRELLVFIQPQIVGGEVSQVNVQRDMESRYDVAPATREFAGGMLPTKPASTEKAGEVDQAKDPSVAKETIPAASKRPSLDLPSRK
ncbi:MAG: secretin N-terminal domain-containing protein [Akkermansiaceae bacterium]